MIQGGDPEGTGMGGPGYTIEDEFVDDLRFDGEGILAMANTGMPHTGGSQFFITLDKTPWLNGHHTIFGKVKEGMDVVRRIGHSETDMQIARSRTSSSRPSRSSIRSDGRGVHLHPRMQGRQPLHGLDE